MAEAPPPLLMFGCGACKQQFLTRELMKEHFATPLHSFNAERKSKGLTPVDQATFRALEPGDDDDVPGRSPKFYCKICDKYYKTVQTLTMHLKSNQHVLNKQKAIEDGASTIHSTASKYLLGSKTVSSKPRPKPPRGGDAEQTTIVPVPVLLIKEVPGDMTEADVHNAFDPFGALHRVLFVRKRNQVLVEMPTTAAAVDVLAACPEGTIFLDGAARPIQYAARESLGRECGWCHKLGHEEDHCFVKARSCAFCRMEGHRKNNCPKLPCICCGTSTHTLEACEHKTHYTAVKAEIRALDGEMRELVEQAQGPPPTTAEGDDGYATPEDEDSATKTPSADASAGEEAARRRDWLQACCCLFCDKVTLSPEECARHMSDKHDFQIPMPDLIDDLYGLMSYLQRKVRAGLCLWCGEKTKYFATTKALRQHMAHLKHRNINWTDNVDEYADFYALPESTALLPEADEDGHCHLPDGRVIASRGGRPLHSHQPGEFLMATGGDTDLGRRNLLLAYKMAAVTADPARRHLTKSQHSVMLQQNIRMHNEFHRNALNLAMAQNGPQFRGYMVVVRRG
jgi:hypothetical protein